MSRRVPRFVEKYAKLAMDDRDRLEQLIDGMLGIGEDADPGPAM
jgi:nitrogen-specific signal transduction histidine kinase